MYKRTRTRAAPGSGAAPPSGGPTFTIPEIVQRLSALKFGTLKVVDQISRSVSAKFGTLKLAETLTRGDAVSLGAISFKIDDRRSFSENGKFSTFILTAVPRSGTPDTDDWGDAWTDNTVGQTGTNHGNVSPLAMAVGIAGVGVNRVLCEINLTRFVGLTATGNNHTFTGVFTNGSALVASTIVLSMCYTATPSVRPFTESTVTQANTPAFGASAFFPVNQNLAAGGTNVLLTWTITDAQMNTILGKWCYIILDTGGGTVAAPDTVVSREGAAANRMKLTFTAQTS